MKVLIIDQDGVGLSFAALMLGLAALERLGHLRLGAWVRRLGAMSYPLYILHAPLLLAVWQITGSFHLATSGQWVMLGVGIMGLYAAAALATVTLDQPLQRRMRRFPPSLRP